MSAVFPLNDVLSSKPFYLNIPWLYITYGITDHETHKLKCLFLVTMV